VAKASAAAAANNNGDGSSPVSVAELFDDTPIHDYMSSVDFGEDFNMTVLEDIFREENGGGDSNGKSNNAASTSGALSSLSLPEAIAASSNPEVAAAAVQEATEAVYRTIANIDDYLSDDSSEEEDDNDVGGTVDPEMSDLKAFLRSLLDDTVGDEEKVSSLLSQPAVAAVATAASDSASAASSLIQIAAPSRSKQEDSADLPSFPDEDKESEEQLSERVFPLKLHKMLENAHRDGIDHIVSWVDDGKGFKVHNSDAFTKEVMPMFFDQTKYESFRRQLNLYSFTRVSRGLRRGIYSHPKFVAGNRPLVMTGVRRKLPTHILDRIGEGGTTTTDMEM
jgi:HSF-type DNA-binding